MGALALTLAVAFALPARASTDLESKKLITTLRADILNRKSGSFNSLLKTWEAKYGAKAALPLSKIAADQANYDPVRYVALMGAAKLGGPGSAPLLVPLLKDPSWMIRSGTLRVLRALGDAKSAPAVLPLLKDPALVVRSEAVETIERLRPPGSVPALLAALDDEQNYHHGRAQWVPQKAVRALAAMRAREAAPKLLALLDRRTDPDLQLQTVNALEALIGRRAPASMLPLKQRIRALRGSLSGSAARPEGVRRPRTAS